MGMYISEKSQIYCNFSVGALFNVVWQQRCASSLNYI